MSEETRKARRNLLTFCAVSMFFALGGIVPKEISALGVELTVTNQKYLYLVAVLIVVYMAVTFLVYVAADTQRLLIAYRAFKGDFNMVKDAANERFQDRLLLRGRAWKGTVLLRAVWELLVPLLVALAAIIALQNTTIPM